ncbi:MAG: DUF4398 domain-containing protein [Xanthomonadales bacterium]|nr:DUF4398 domain-containing protein [Xanthomonadales bacterium]
MKIQQVSIVALTLAATLGIAACSTTPKRNMALEEARQSHQRAKSSPQVLSLAGEEMAQADAALAQAERAWNAREPQTTVDHLAYMAGRHVSLAEATASSIASQAIVDGAGAERDRLRLAQRTQEANASRDAAERSQMAADNAQRDASQAQRDAGIRPAGRHRSRRAMRMRHGARSTVWRLTWPASTHARPSAAWWSRWAMCCSIPRARSASGGHNQSTQDCGCCVPILHIAQRSRAIPTMSVAPAPTTCCPSVAPPPCTSLWSISVSSEQLSITPRGQEFPAASNETASGRQMNRRVEVIFSAVEPVAIR